MMLSAGAVKLSGAHETALPASKLVDGRPFPITFSPDENRAPATELAGFITENQTTLQQTVATHGAVLLRGWTGDYLGSPRGSAYPVGSKRRHAPPSAETFADAFAALGLSVCDMACSSAPRKPVAPGVYTSNEAPPQELIPFHHEMAQCPSQPTYIVFFCETPPAEGGETPILPSVWAARYLRKAHPETAERLSQRGVRYVRIIPGETDAASPLGRGWKATFKVETREEAERELERMEMSYEWLPSGDLKAVSKQMPALVMRDGKETFYNAAVAAIEGWADARNDASKAVVYGDDGAALLLSDLNALRDTADYMRSQQVSPHSSLTHPLLYPKTASLTPSLPSPLPSPHACQIAFEWQAGDMLLLDNRLAMHSRKSFTPPRRILAAVGGPPADRRITTKPHDEQYDPNHPSMPSFSLDQTTPNSMPSSPPDRVGPYGRSLYGDIQAARMPKLTLRSFDTMPAVGLGLWKIPKSVTAKAVYEAIRDGYRHLDCACDYGNEVEVGKGIACAIKDGIVTREVKGSHHHTNHPPSLAPLTHPPLLRPPSLAPHTPSSPLPPIFRSYG